MFEDTRHASRDISPPARGVAMHITRRATKPRLVVPRHHRRIQDMITRDLAVHPTRPALLTALGLCGLRSIELRQLLAFDWHPPTLHVDTAKGGRPRNLHLPEVIAHPLSAWAAHTIQVHNYHTSRVPMFPTANHQPLDPKQVTRDITAYTKKACGTQYSPHKLRHTFAAAAYETTHDLVLVQNLLGHKDIRNTMIYLDALTAEQYTLNWAEPVEAKREDQHHIDAPANSPRKPRLAIFPPRLPAPPEISIQETDDVPPPTRPLRTDKHSSRHDLAHTGRVERPETRPRNHRTRHHQSNPETLPPTNRHPTTLSPALPKQLMLQFQD